MKNKPRKIRGSGGGGGGGGGSARIPVEAPDSLRSKAFLRIMDLISEGPIGGLVDGAKSVYLEETPLQNADGSYNFAGVTFEQRLGTQDQTYIEGFDAVENEVGVNVEVRNSTPIVRQVTDPNVNRVRLRLFLPQLTYTDPGSGDVSGTSVTMAVDVQPNGGSYTEVISRVISGKSSSKYEVTISFVLAGTGPWNIRVRRVSGDSTTQNLQNRTYVSSLVEIIDGKLRYPNSALIGVRLDAQQFQSVPARSYEVDGIEVRVPSNYDSETRVYTGSWDGTFQLAQSNNPAWVFYDLATNARYGLGDFIPESEVDKWALYEIARYCDELVPDGFGELEPRFTCNLVIADRAEAYTVMQNLASVFRGMIFWSAGAVTATQDAPQDPAYLFSPSNVVDGKFTYQGASAKARATVVLVTWNDPLDFYRQKVEYVEDQPAIAKFGIQKSEINAFGCTSRGQAHRLGKWLLYTQQNESEIVSFKTGLEGIVGRPGQVIRIADPTRAGARMGGRISTATTTLVTIDADIAGSFGGSTMGVILPNGTVEERTVVSSASRTYEVQPAFTTAPNSGSAWMIRNTTIEAQTFRVINVKEDDDGTFTISALRHDPDKFDFVEQGNLLETKNYSILTAVPDAPQNLILTESLYQTSTEVRAKITASWSRVDRAASYVVRYRRDDDNFVDLPETQFNDIEILDVRPGEYTVIVSAVNSVGKRSAPTQVSQQILGKAAPPGDVTGFSMIPNQGQAYLSWTKSVDLDVIVGGQVRIRHTPRITLQSWSDAIDIIPAVAGSATSAVAPLLTGTYFAKFVDSSGFYSDEEALIVTTIPQALALNVVETVQEDPGFAGVRQNMIIDTLNGALVLEDTMLIDDFPLIDSVGAWDFPGNISPYGQYDFENHIDLEGVWPTRIYAEIDLQAFDAASVIDSRAYPIDLWPDIDGGVVNDVNAELYVQTTEDDPADIAAEWTVWKRISAGAYAARGFRFQLRCTSENVTHNLYIKQLRITLDMEDRVVDVGPIASGAALYHVGYPEGFFVPPALSVTANNMGSGDYYTITNADEFGFDITFFNSSNTAVSRVFSAIAKGYGRKVA